MQPDYPDNPVLCRVRRGAWIESQHRGAWVFSDASGHVVDGAGDWETPVFARSAIKSLQALPLVESGAAERFGYGDAELALALSSHNAEPCHTDAVEGILARLGLTGEALRCGAQAPGDPAARKELAAAGAEPTAVHNNCSGKHAGFLALGAHLGAEPQRYLDAGAEVQRAVREAVCAMCDVDPAAVTHGVDGCSAPTYRLPLAAMATGIARVTNAEGLIAERRAACEWMQRAVAAHPVLIAGSHKRIDTDIARVSGGRLFPKIGAEAVYLVGVRGGDRGLAVKIDDGSWRALHAVVVGLLERLELASPDELAALEGWRGRPMRNWAGLEVGALELAP